LYVKIWLIEKKGEPVDLDSAREIKELLVERLTITEPGLSYAALPLGASAAAMLPSSAYRMVAHRHGGVADAVRTAVSRRPVPVAIGIAPTRRRGDYRIAVRIQDRRALRGGALQTIRQYAGRELDLRYIGRIVAQGARPWHQSQSRPLVIGTSLAHPSVKAGTLGCFVSGGEAGELGLVSANHVLAAENAAATGDPILQPAPKDGGKRDRHVIGQLSTVVRLQRHAVNEVDCALAAVDPSAGLEPGRLAGVGALSGVVKDLPDEDELVQKLGRTTGHTHGRITAFALNTLPLNYRSGAFAFDGLMEIQSTGGGPFSRGGDSGALVFRSQDNAARGLVIGGAVIGGANGAGLTYAVELPRVLDQLKVRLLT
jgi:hypothetical protein